MIEISAGAKAEIEKLRGRSLKARCRIDYSDFDIDSTIVAGGNIQKPGSYFEHVYNGKRIVDQKWASLDSSWVVGEYALAPETQGEIERFEIGAWGTRLSGAGGIFERGESELVGEPLLFGEQLLVGEDDKPELFVSFSPRNFTGFFISFDDARQEYAVDFDVIFYGEGFTEIKREDVRGNNGIQVTRSFEQVEAVREIRFEAYKWSHENRQYKVCEFLTSVSELYQGDDIISLRVLESRDTGSADELAGSTLASEVVLTIFNRNRLFDFDNKSSRLFGLIRENNRIIPEISPRELDEWIPLGVFFAKAWDVSKQDISVTVTGLDRMALLADTQFTDSTIIQAPEDQDFSVVTDANWNAGSLENIKVSGGAISIDWGQA